MYRQYICHLLAIKCNYFLCILNIPAVSLHVHLQVIYVRKIKSHEPYKPMGCYVVNTIYIMYLQTETQDETSHPMVNECSRISY